MTAAALLLAVGALAAPASAAMQNTAADRPQSQTSASSLQLTHRGGTAAGGDETVLAPFEAGALKNQSVLPAFSTCQVDLFGYIGEGICGTTAYIKYANGVSVEAFIIGTNWAIWHAWPGSNGWHSLGGAAQQSTSNGVFSWSSNPYAIWTYGTDGKQWCDNWGIPAWGGWHLCK